MAFLSRHKLDLSYFAVSLLLGISGAVFADLSLSGLVWRGELYVLALTPILMIAIFAAEGVWSSKKPQWCFVRLFLWPAASFVLVLIGWQVAERLLPDAATLYFTIRQSYIEANWKTDPSGMVYFPIRYEKLDQGTKQVPQFFFALDKDNTFVIDPYTNDLVRPTCPTASYAAREVSGRVYIVQLYNHPDISFGLCLVAPTELLNHD